MNCMLTTAVTTAKQTKISITGEIPALTTLVVLSEMISNHWITWIIRIERWMMKHASFTPYID